MALAKGSRWGRQKYCIHLARSRTNRTGLVAAEGLAALPSGDPKPRCSNRATQLAAGRIRGQDSAEQDRPGGGRGAGRPGGAPPGHQQHGRDTEGTGPSRCVLPALCCDCGWWGGRGWASTAWPLLGGGRRCGRGRVWAVRAAGGPRPRAVHQSSPTSAQRRICGGRVPHWSHARHEMIPMCPSRVSAILLAAGGCAH